MATLPHPASDGGRAEGPLSDRERAILDDIAGHENAVARARVRDRAIQAAVVVALAALLLPASWFVAGALTLVLLVVPTLLLVELWRTDVAARRRRADGP